MKNDTSISTSKPIVGERRQIRVKESAIFADKVLGALLDGIYVYDVNLRRNVFVNDPYTRMTGYTAEELEMIGETDFLRLFHPEDRRKVAEYNRKIVSGGEDVSVIEYRFRTKDGRWIWCLSRDLVFSRCPDGTVCQVIGTVMDITDRKLVERKLRKSEERYRRLTGLIPAAMYMIDSEGAITYYNEQAARIWGRSPRTGDTEERFCGSFRLYRPDGSRLPHDQTPMAVSLRTGVSFRAQEVTIERPDGMILKISVNIDAIRDADGRICGAINVFTDITEHKKTEEALRKSEELFRTVVENSWDGIHQVDLSTGRFVFTSPSLGRLTGFTSEELMLPMKDVADRLHPADREAVRRYLKRIIAGERPEKHLEYRWRVKSGEYRWFSDSRQAIFDKDGKAVALVGVTRDITDTKQFQSSLEHTKIELEKKVARRTALAEARARQLQELAVELIEAEEAERRRISQLLHEDLQQVLAAARFQLQSAMGDHFCQSALANVDKFMGEAIAKSRSLSHELSPPMLQHSRLVDSLKWLIEQMEDQFGLQVELKANTAKRFKSGPLKIFMFRAVQELLFNVVKHGGVNSARVVLSGSDDSLTVSVWDQGTGFFPDFLDTSAATHGLGLLSMRERARYLGGDLVIESAPGKGSCLTLSVPLQLNENEKQEKRREASEADGKSAAPVKNKTLEKQKRIRIVCVDDHQMMRRGLMELLGGQPGIEIAGEAANGLEAIDVVAKVEPDVVLMDVSMPKMNGIQATRRIKEESPGLRIIGLSMYQDEQTAQSMLEAGADIYLSKTASPAELLAAVYGDERGGR